MAGNVWRAKVFLMIVSCSLALILFLSWTSMAANKQPTTDKNVKVLESHINMVTDSHFHVNVDDVSRMSSGIPKIIHQTFETELAYQNYLPMINSCLTHNPDWAYYLWRDSDAVSLIRKEYPQYLKMYTNYRDNLQRSDAIRYVVLHRFGGIYLDMDVECLRPFHPALTSYAAFVDQERVEQTQVFWGQEFSAMNSAMGSVPGHPFYSLMADTVLLKEVAGNAFYTTGPAVLTRVYRDYRGGQVIKKWPVTLLPPNVMSPQMDAEKDWRGRCKGALSTGLSWKDRGCQMLQSKQWRLDDTDNGTIGVHRFLHLGYAFGAHHRKAKFNLTETFWPRVTFYRSPNS